MRRALLAIAAVAAIVLVVILVTGGDDKEIEGYQVRAVFDNGGFVVRDENVRIAGANVGAIESVDVSRPGEIVSYEDGEPTAIPGKAVVVLSITDKGFQDFRQDASCLIRPQSLIGEKYIDCKPTQGRAPGTEPPPPLEVIPDGEPGAGQYLLPLENNGNAVDLDLIQNIQRLPYRERFRLIVNDLGAGLAARGEDLNEIVRRANPALRETDEVLKILADQNQQLATLAEDGDTSLGPLARERDSLTGFIRSSGATAAATAARADDLETNLRLLPPTLRELQTTMTTLGDFSDAARPFFTVLGNAAPEITRGTRLLSPFSDATTVSLKSLGDTAQPTGDDLEASEPIVRKVRGLATTAQSPATNLGKLTKSFREQQGNDSLMRFIYNTAGSVNGYDQFGHYLRTNILVSGCAEYTPGPAPNCVTRFTGPLVQDQSSARGFQQRIIKQALRDYRSGGSSVPLSLPDNGATTGLGLGEVPEAIGAPDTGAPGETGATGATGATGDIGAPRNLGPGDRQLRTGADVLDYLMGQ